MNLSEFIGFIITMIAFFLLIVKQGRDAKRKREHPEEYEREIAEEEKRLHGLLKSLDLEDESEEYYEKEIVQRTMQSQSHPVERQLEKPRSSALKESLPAYQLKNFQTREFLDIHAKEKPGDFRVTPEQIEQRSRILKDLKDAKMVRDAVLLREILGPPKGL